MIYLFLFGLLLMAFTVWVVTLTIPFLPLFPIIWSAVGFLLLAEFIFLFMLGLVMARRSVKGTPVTLSFLVFPILYVLCSCAIVPWSFSFLTFTPLLLCHFSLILVLLGLGFAMIGAAGKNKADTQQRGVRRMEIRKKAAALQRCVSALQGMGKGCAPGALCLVAERMEYAPESDDSDDCRACDIQIDELIGSLEACVAAFSPDDEKKSAELAKVTASLQAALEQRRLALTK